MSAGTLASPSRDQRAAIGAAAAFALLFGIALALNQVIGLVALVAGSIVVAIAFTNPRVALYAAIALMPLEAVGRVVPSVSEVTWAKVALVLTVFAVGARVLTDRERVAVPGFAASLLALLGALLAGALLHPDANASLWGVVAIGGQMVLVVIMYNLLDDPHRIERMLLVIAAGSVPVCVFSILDTLTERSFLQTFAYRFFPAGQQALIRVTSTFYDPNALGRYLGWALVITLGLAFMRKGFVRRLVLLALAGVQAYSLLVTFSRGAALSLVAALVLMAFLQRGALRRAGPLVSVGVFAAVFTALSGPALFVLAERLTGGSGAILSDPTRLRILGWSLTAVGGSPFVGYGMDGVTAAVAAVAGRAFSTHDLYFEVLLAGGLLGFLLFAGVIVYFIRRAWRLRAQEHWPIAAIVVTAMGFILLSGLSLHGFRENEIWVTLGLLAAVARLAAGDAGSALSASEQSGSLRERARGGLDG